MAMPNYEIDKADKRIQKLALSVPRGKPELRAALIDAVSYFHGDSPGLSVLGFGKMTKEKVALAVRLMSAFITFLISSTLMQGALAGLSVPATNAPMTSTAAPTQ